MKIHEIIGLAFSLAFILPLIYASFATGTVAGIIFGILLVLVAVIAIPSAFKLGRMGERTAEIRRMEEAKYQGRMAKFCRNLSRLSSVIVKCPKCQRTFLRVDSFDCVLEPGSELHNKYAKKYKRGQLSSDEYQEIFLESLRESGYPSSFKCPKCMHVIIRSREPSGICEVTGERVSREKLLDCTLGKCHLSKD